MDSKMIRLSTLLLLFFLSITGCEKKVVDGNERETAVAADDIYSKLEKTPDPGEIFSTEPDPFIDSILSKMTLEEKVGQLLFPAVQPGRMTKEYLENKHFENYKPGGFVLFGSSMMKTAQLIRELQQYSKIPLLFAEDFERGVAMRIPGAKSYPFNMALAAANSPLLVYEMGKRIARDSKILGVNWNLSPVADINNNIANPIINVRSFGEDPEQVAELAIMMMKGLHAGGVLSSLKHFPGHGNTSTDSHTDLAVIKGTDEQFRSTELFPFRKCIEKGAYSVMVGHLGVESQNTPDTPATLSYNIVTKLLREQLGFKGIANTDAMSMKAVSKYNKPGEAAVRTIKAGMDVIMASLDSKEAFIAIVAAVRRGEIKESRIDLSVRKVLQAKRWTGLFGSKPASLTEVSELDSEREVDEIARDLAIRSITLLKSNPGLFPLDKKKKYFHLVIKDGRDFPNYKSFLSELNSRNKNIDTWELPLKPDDTDLEILSEKLTGTKEVIVSVYLQIRNATGKINMEKSTIKVVQDLLKKGKKVILLAHCHPYILLNFPQVDVFLTNYGAEIACEKALAAAVFGENNISGRLPVSIPGTEFKRGSGIDLLKEQGRTQGLSDKYKRIDELVNSGIKDSIFPGAAISIIKDGKLFYENSYGRFTYDPTSFSVKTNSMYDIASLTKVTATTFAVMKLLEEGKISLEYPVEKYIPEFVNKKKITIKTILIHTSGLPASGKFFRSGKGPDEIFNEICELNLDYKTGTKTVYSDLGMIVLGRLIEKVAGKNLDQYMREIMWSPMGMLSTKYNPEQVDIPYCVPTEIDDFWRNRLIQGSVHDENCFALGGMTGHAGLFSTVEDIRKFMIMLLSGGVFDGVRYLKQETITQFITRQSNSSSRALGWDTNFKHAGVGGKSFAENSFGHTGFTGTSIWADYRKKFAVILFTNRVYPTRKKEGIKNFRIRLHEALATLLM